MMVGIAQRVVIGCVPDADLSSNSRAHYMVKARKVAALREFVGWQTREDAPPEPFAGPVLLTISIGWPKGRKRQDPSNVAHCLKAVIDGMTDARWWVDDKQVTIKEPIEQRTWGQWQNQGGWLYPHGSISIEVESAPDEEAITP